MCLLSCAGLPCWLAAWSKDDYAHTSGKSHSVCLAQGYAGSGMNHSQSRQIPPCFVCTSSAAQAVLQLGFSRGHGVTHLRASSHSGWRPVVTLHLITLCCVAVVTAPAMARPNYRTARTTFHRWQTRRWQPRALQPPGGVEEGVQQQASPQSLDFSGSAGGQAGKTCSCNGAVLTGMVFHVLDHSIPCRQGIHVNEWQF